MNSQFLLILVQTILANGKPYAVDYLQKQYAKNPQVWGFGLVVGHLAVDQFLVPVVQQSETPVDDNLVDNVKAVIAEVAAANGITLAVLPAPAV